MNDKLNKGHRLHFFVTDENYDAVYRVFSEILILAINTKSGFHTSKVYSNLEDHKFRKYFGSLAVAFSTSKPIMHPLKSVDANDVGSITPKLIDVFDDNFINSFAIIYPKEAVAIPNLIHGNNIIRTQVTSLPPHSSDEVILETLAKLVETIDAFDQKEKSAIPMRDVELVLAFNSTIKDLFLLMLLRDLKSVFLEKEIKLNLTLHLIQFTDSIFGNDKFVPTELKEVAYVFTDSVYSPFNDTPVGKYQKFIAHAHGLNSKYRQTMLAIYEDDAQKEAFLESDNIYGVTLNKRLLVLPVITMANLETVTGLKDLIKCIVSTYDTLMLLNAPMLNETNEGVEQHA